MTTRFTEALTPKGEFEVPREIIIDEETVAALDLDMALIQSYRLSDMVYATLRATHADDPKALQTINTVEAAEQSQVGRDFPYLDDLRVALGDAGMMTDPENFARLLADAHRGKSGQLTEEFVDYIMIEGAVDYIRALHEAKADWLIITAGGEFSQRFKVELLRLILMNEAVMAADQTVSYMVTDSSVSKTDLIHSAASQGQLDMSRLTGLSVYSQMTPRLTERHYRQVILTDDKIFHLTGTRQGDGSRSLVTPILIKRGGDTAEPGAAISEVAKSIYRVY